MKTLLIAAALLASNLTYAQPSVEACKNLMQSSLVAADAQMQNCPLFSKVITDMLHDKIANSGCGFVDKQVIDSTLKDKQLIINNHWDRFTDPTLRTQYYCDWSMVYFMEHEVR